MDKRLFKSEDNKVFCGVCGGIGDYFNIDPVVIRIAWVIFACMGGCGLVAYIIAAIIVPRKPIGYTHQEREQNRAAEMYNANYKE